MNTTDRELWSRTQAGNPDGFSVLFERHAKTVYNHAFRLTASWSLAEDVTQSTFLVAWRRRSEARLVDDSILPWLLVVATNIARSEARAARRWLALLRRVPVGAGQAPDLADDVVGRIDDERRMAEILDAVRRLPRAEREAVALCLWSAVAYRDAAVVLGISEASVRSRVSRARGRLTAMESSQPREA